uniref:Uncharacterized protein n=1 Tax=Molossus molossus TaxID=27622 RepID=A0A7J8JXD3_MOLMO|nr:hypothetical protein HJG59_008109 [Molossus molossus]
MGQRLPASLPGLRAEQSGRAEAGAGRAGGMLWTRGGLSPHGNTGTVYSGPIRFSRAGHPAPTFPASMWGSAECVVSRSSRSTVGLVRWTAFIKDSIRNSVGVSRSWASCVLYSVGCSIGGPHDVCMYCGGEKGINTKPFSTTFVTVMRLYYLQMVIGRIIFIEQLFLVTFW